MKIFWENIGNDGLFKKDKDIDDDGSEKIRAKKNTKIQKGYRERRMTIRVLRKKLGH